MNYINFMGTTNTRISKSTELSNIKSTQEDAYDEYVQYDECCGMEVKKVIKRTLIWQDNFLRNCQSLKPYSKWCQELIDLVRSKKLSRVSFLREVNALKTQQCRTSLQTQEEILLSPSQIDQFKSNLKKSVLLSYSQAVKTKPRQSSQLRPESAMIMTPKKPARKNDIYIDHFRKSNIMKQPSALRSSKSDFRDSLMSFVDDTISSLFRSEAKEISKQNAVGLEVFVHFTMLMENHFSNERSIISHIKRCFVSSIQKEFSNIKVTGKVMEDLINSIKQFLVILKEVVIDYYYIDSWAELPQGQLICNQENILTVVTAVLFKEENFYSFLFETVKQFQEKREIKMRTVMGKLYGNQPEEFEIKHQYCLNSRTMKQYMEEMGSMEKNLQNLEIEQLHKSDEPPYYKCFLALKEIIKTRTPIAKMKVIMDCSEKITESITDFYVSNGMQVKNWVLDADQILSIFCYILANTRIPFLHSHLFILQHFATDHQLISVTGYYYSVLTCAIEQLEKMDES